jgi:hypothetical protein
MVSMFHSASAFNQPLNFDTSNATMVMMRNMFSSAPFMNARYPDGLPIIAPAIRWLNLQREWALEWGRIQQSDPARAARIQQKHNSCVDKIRDWDATKQEGVCVACLVKPAMFVFEKCKHQNICESCVNRYLQHDGKQGVFECMLCRNPHRVDQIKSILQWLSENLEHDDELRLSGGCNTIGTSLDRPSNQTSKSPKTAFRASVGSS